MQIDYSQNPAVGYPGMIADTGPRHVVSRSNPSVPIPFGCFVSKGTDQDHVKLPTTSSEVTASGVGFAIQDWSTEQVVADTVATFPIKSAVPVMKQGRLWVVTEEAVNAEDPVFVRFATGSGGTQLGAVRKSADTTTAVQLPGARFETSALALGLVQIIVNVP